MTFRSICIAVYVFFYLIFTTPERIRLKKLEQTDPQEASRIAQEHVQKVFRHLLKISGVTIEVNGLENIPDEAALFVGNHSSYFDIIVTGAAIPGGVGFVAKDSLGNIPGLSLRAPQASMLPHRVRGQPPLRSLTYLPRHRTAHYPSSLSHRSIPGTHRSHHLRPYLKNYNIS